VDGRTYGRTGRHFFPLILLGRLFEVDLIICNTYYTLIVIFVISDLTSQKNQMQIVLIFIARQHTDARHLYSNYSVCPSVCLSVHPSVRNVPVSDENG